MRTIDQIRVRFNNKARLKDDFFGYGYEVLGQYLPETFEDPETAASLTEESVLAEAKEYLDFAFEKASGHRGLSASRSVIKLREWMWILGYDDVVEFADDPKNYPYYGVPILKRVAQTLGVEIPEEIARWEDGSPCSPHCDMGC